MMRQVYIPAICFLLLSMVRVALSDDIYFAGSPIPLKNCQIEQIAAGQLVYFDRQGRRHRRTLDEIDALTFDELPQLAKAEKALRENEDQAALLSYLQALLNTQQEMHRLWLHIRLNHYHDLRGQYIEAAAHAVSAFMIQDDAYWRKLEPVSEVKMTTYPALHEAFHLLQQADREIISGELASVVDRMFTAVRIMYEQRSADYTGHPLAVGSTISGYRKDDIRDGRLQKVDHSLQTVEPPSPETSTPPMTTRGKRLSPREVDALLDAGEFPLALTACRHIARNPGERDLSHFLRQYGWALKETDHPEEAAIMLTRCMVLYPETEHATWCTITLATIYNETYVQPDTTRRLLQRALEQAKSQQHQELIQLAQNKLQLLEK